MPVEVGDVAPDFELSDQHHARVRLSSYRGLRNVVVVFYPWAFTRVCAGELAAIRDRLSALQNEHVQVLAVSCDAVGSLRAFAEQERLDYPLLSDFWPHGAVARAYGVFREDVGVALRGTFVVDRDGVVRWRLVHPIAEARDVTEYEKVLAGL